MIGRRSQRGFHDHLDVTAVAPDELVIGQRPFTRRPCEHLNEASVDQHQMAGKGPYVPTWQRG